MACLVAGAASPEISAWLCNYNQAVVAQDSTVSSEQSGPLTLSIETKYYKASVDVQVFDSAECSEADLEAADAFICVLTTEEEQTNPEEFEVHLGAGTKLSEEKDVATRLLVKVGEVSEDSSAVRLMTWALDHGFEYVYIDRTNLMSTANEREKEGLPRLMECMHSTAWRSMESSVPKQNVFRFQEGTGTSSASSGSSSNSSSSSSSTTTMNSVNTASGISIDDAAGNLFLENEVIPVETDEEMKAQNFENLMEQAMKLRDDVHSGSLSDEQRREKAAQFALQFASVFDDDDSVDSEA